MKPDISQVQVRLPTATHQALKAEAVRIERSVNWIIVRLLGKAAVEFPKLEQPK